VIRYELKSQEELPQLCECLEADLEGCKKVLLIGDLGAGKTTLVNAFCKHLGVETPGNSPTFSLINQYAYTRSDGNTQFIHHIDLYRLDDLEEALDIGIEDLLDDDSLCFIEWPQLIEPILPPNYAILRIEVDMESETRHIQLEIINS
jgi:tRNA threonylcarbamoyladenosine biosynthesis protein TsaE